MSNGPYFNDGYFNQKVNKKSGKNPAKSNPSWDNSELASSVPKPLAALNPIDMASRASQILDRAYVYICMIVKIRKILKIFSKNRKISKKKNGCFEGNIDI